jgi:hypothetical protein
MFVERAAKTQSHVHGWKAWRMEARIPQQQRRRRRRRRRQQQQRQQRGGNAQWRRRDVGCVFASNITPIIGFRSGWLGAFDFHKFHFDFFGSRNFPPDGSDEHGELNYILVCVFKQIVFYLSLFLNNFSAQKDYGIRSIADCTHPSACFGRAAQAPLQPPQKNTGL